MLGLKIQARYYFMTLTTTPKSPELRYCWTCLRLWIRRYRKDTKFCYCLTSEGKGKGVIHMVLRLGQKEKRFDIKEVRKYWHGLTGAVQVNIKRVTNQTREKLATYISDQRKLVGMGKEMAWQPGIIFWRCSKGWLPVGFTREFGRFWFNCCQKSVPDKERDLLLTEWLRLSVKKGELQLRPVWKKLEPVWTI